MVDRNISGGRAVGRLVVVDRTNNTGGDVRWLENQGSVPGQGSLFLVRD